MTDDTASIEFDVSARDLFLLFADVTPFAEKTGTLPPLSGVALESDGDYLVAVATDRYSIGASRLKIDPPISIEQHTISLHDIARLERTFKPSARGLDIDLHLTIGAAGLVVEQLAPLGAELPSVRVSCEWKDTKFPEWRSILAKTSDAETPADMTVAWNPDLIARCSKARRGSAGGIRLYASAPNKPWRIGIGDHFVGAIMPMRIDETFGTWLPAEQRERPAPAAPAKRTSRRKKAAA